MKRHEKSIFEKKNLNCKSFGEGETNRNGNGISSNVSGTHANNTVLNDELQLLEISRKILTFQMVCYKHLVKLLHFAFKTISLAFATINFQP